MNDKIKEIEHRMNQGWYNSFAFEDVEHLLSIITSLQEERDRYRTALEKIVSHGPETVMETIGHFKKWESEQDDKTNADWSNYVYDLAQQALKEE